MYVTCPHCDGEVEIVELNCKIFRHSVYKKDGKQVDPHASKELCDQLIKEGSIYGCGKPFKIVDNKAVKCEYI